MTADVELLPLPEYLYGREASDNERVVTVADAHAHALRNVVHATAPLQAEIEALLSDLADYMRIANAEATRAERLAEALRYAVDNPDFDSERFDALARAALEQEACRG